MIRYISRNLLNLKTDRKGLETLEYAIIAAVFVGVGLVGYNSLFTSVNTGMSSLGTTITTAAAAAKIP